MVLCGVRHDRPCQGYGVLIDFTALPEAPRTDDENETFKLALPALNVFYSNRRTVVLKITKFPEGYPHNSQYDYGLPENAKWSTRSVDGVMRSPP